MRRSVRRPSPAIVVSIVSLVVAMAGVADAATGGNFILGQANTASTSTALNADINGPALAIANNKLSGASVTGLSITVPSNKAPLTVSSAVRVKKLNADLIDGVDSADLQRRVGGSCPDGTSVQAIAVEGTVTCEDTVVGASFAADAAHAGTADLFAGFGPSAFTQGPGQNVKGAAAIPKGNGFAAIFLATSSPDLLFAYNCPADLATVGVLVFANNSTELVNVFYDNGGENPVYAQVAANGGRLDLPAAPAGERYTFQVQGSQITTAEIFSVHRPASNDCHTEGQALISR